jgi:hypothetical protein
LLFTTVKEEERKEVQYREGIEPWRIRQAAD